MLAIPLLASALLLAGPAPDVSVAVLPLDGKGGVPENTLALVSEIALEQVRRRSLFKRVLSPVEISALMPREQQALLVSCATSECAIVDTEIAGALGVTHMLVGQVGRVGDSLVFSLKLLDLRTALAVGTMTDRIRNGTEDALLDAIPRAVDSVMLQARLYREDPKASPLRVPLIASGSVGAAAGGALGIVSLLVVGGGVAWLLGLHNQAFVGLLPRVGDRDVRFISAWAPGPILLAMGALVLAGAIILLGAGAAGVASGLMVRP